MSQSVQVGILAITFVVVAVIVAVAVVLNMAMAQEPPPDDNEGRDPCFADPDLPECQESTPVPTPLPTEDCPYHPIHCGGWYSTPVPTAVPTAVPTEPPTAIPTEPPTAVPTEPPTEPPTEIPTERPTEPPTSPPSPPSRPGGPTNTAVPPPNAPSTPGLPDDGSCTDNAAPRENPQTDKNAGPRVNLWFLNSTLSPRECDEIRVYIDGDFPQSNSYTLNLRTGGGLSFSRNSCSDRTRTWNLQGRTWYKRDYPVWACNGSTSGSLTGRMVRNGVTVASSVTSTTISSPPVSAPTKVPTRTPTRTPHPTIAPTIAPHCSGPVRSTENEPREVGPLKVLDIQVQPVLDVGECVDVNLILDGLDPDGIYALQLTPSVGLSWPKDANKPV